MIDVEKTNLLKNRVKQEKINSEKNDPAQTTELSQNLQFLIAFITRILGFYGAQWVFLTHFHRVPFSFLESLLIFITFIALLNYKK